MKADIQASLGLAGPYSGRDAGLRAASLAALSTALSGFWIRDAPSLRGPRPGEARLSMARRLWIWKGSSS